MSRKIDPEHVLAYVEGELTGSALRAMQQREADDPALAQLVAQLREDRAGLGALPLEGPPRDLLEDLVPALERSTLLGEVQPAKRRLSPVVLAKIGRGLAAAAVVGVVVLLGGLVFMSMNGEWGWNDLAGSDEVAQSERQYAGGPAVGDEAAGVAGGAGATPQMPATESLARDQGDAEGLARSAGDVVGEVPNLAAAEAPRRELGESADLAEADLLAADRPTGGALASAVEADRSAAGLGQMARAGGGGGMMFEDGEALPADAAGRGNAGVAPLDGASALEDAGYGADLQFDQAGQLNEPMDDAVALVVGWEQRAVARSQRPAVYRQRPVDDAAGPVVVVQTRDAEASRRDLLAWAEASQNVAMQTPSAIQRGNRSREQLSVPAQEPARADTVVPRPRLSDTDAPSSPGPLTDVPSSPREFRSDRQQARAAAPREMPAAAPSSSLRLEAAAPTPLAAAAPSEAADEWVVLVRDQQSAQDLTIYMNASADGRALRQRAVLMPPAGERSVEGEAALGSAATQRNTAAAQPEAADGEADADVEPGSRLQRWSRFSPLARQVQEALTTPQTQRLLPVVIRLVPETDVAPTAPPAPAEPRERG
jgi:hypothetical protein